MSYREDMRFNLCHQIIIFLILAYKKTPKKAPSFMSGMNLGSQQTVRKEV